VLPIELCLMPGWMQWVLAWLLGWLTLASFPPVWYCLRKCKEL
jgi:hypothetical protein